MGDFNVALVIVAAVVLLVSVYLLLFVVLGLTVAVLSILILPADVANRQACRKAVYNGACDLTLPMRTLWLVVYIVDAVLAFLVIPFAMFYYEGDQDKSVGKRLRTAATPCGSTVSSMHINFWHCGKPFSIGPVDCSAPSSPVATALSPGGAPPPSPTSPATTLATLMAGMDSSPFGVGGQRRLATFMIPCLGSPPACVQATCTRVSWVGGWIGAGWGFH
uniref:Uncharacterized protein n=1 Tax=Oryza meridionalis TaxID=40149 RepID=A0A0E0DKP4_9ORYZ